MGKFQVLCQSNVRLEKRERDDVIGGGERGEKRLMGNSKISNAVFYYSIETDAYSLTIGLAWNRLVV